MANVGRPPTITEEDKRVIVELVAMGCSMRAAAARVGLDESTLRYHRKEDKAFSRNLKKALSECEQEHVNNIRAAGSLQWQASAWFLERRWSRDWGRKEKLEHSGPKGGPIEVEGRVSAQRFLSNPEALKLALQAEKLARESAKAEDAPPTA